MKISIFFDQVETSGGGFQQSISDTKLFLSLFSKEHKIFIYCTPSIKKKLIFFFHSFTQLTFVSYKYSFINKIYDLIIYLLKTSSLFSPILKKYFLYTKFEKLFLKKKIDIVYFLAPNIYSRYLHTILYYITVWDNCSRSFPEFPEARKNYRFELLEKLLPTTLQKSSAIFVDSMLTRDNISKNYQISEKKIFINPISCSPDLNLIPIDFRNNLGTKEYILYPAQFWAHKNHAYIVRAIKLLKNLYGKKLHVNFTGSDKGNQSFIRKLIEDNELNDSFTIHGYVEPHKLQELYLNAAALVMPSYFGPMNIPLLDAIKVRLPVFYPFIYSDHIPFTHDDITYIDLDEPLDLVNKLKELFSNPNFYYDKAIKGYNKLLVFNHDSQNNLKKLVKSTSSLISTYK